MISTHNSRAFLLSSAALFAFAMAQPAIAQVQEDQPAPQDDASATDVDESEIIITAQKRRERILDIPQSVTVVSGDTMESQHATTFQQYLNEIPGLSITESEPGSTRLTLRGVNTGGVSSTVAVYVDEMPYGSSTALVNGAILTGDIDPFDLARIEVLRGPQGTLYGANSLGGIFKYVTNTPKLGEFSARARGGLEFVDHGGTGYNANGLVNVPLGDQAAFRASGFYRKRAGWVDANSQDITIDGLFGGSLTATSLDDENINDNKSWGGRGSVLFQPSEQLTVRLTAFLQNLNTHGSSLVEVDPEDLDTTNGKFGRTAFIPEFNHFKYRIYNATVEYDLGFASLLSATSWGELNSSFRTDITPAIAPTINSVVGPLSPFPDGLPAGSPFPFAWPAQITTDTLGVYQGQVTGVRKFTQELRLASPASEVFEWMVGAYYTKEKGHIEQHINGLVLDDPSALQDELADLLALNLDSKYRETAGFANVTWHLSDRFDITGGVRLSKNKQRSSQVVTGPVAPIQFGGAIPVFDDGSSSESVFTYSLAPRFEISPNSAIYARIAKGYRPGGPNAVPPLSGPALDAFPVTFDADTLTNYEVGYKLDMGRGASFDIAAYHLVWKDIQVIGSTASGFSYNENGKGAVVDGIEGALNLRPTPGLRLSLNGAWMNPRLTADTPGLVGGQDGDTLPYSPKIGFAANADYEWPLSAGVTAFVGGSLRYSGKQRAGFRIDESTIAVDPEGNFTADALPQRRIPDYATIDLRAGADFRRFTLEAYVRNLTNSRGITALNEETGLPSTANTAAFIQPRTIGFTIGTEF
jgi:outer membrane receptor protein involved in Fe transport